MDEITIKSPFMLNLISHVLESVIRKKTGCNISVCLPESITVERSPCDEIHLVLSTRVEASIDQRELKEILKKQGLYL